MKKNLFVCSTSWSIDENRSNIFNVQNNNYYYFNNSFVVSSWSIGKNNRNNICNVQKMCLM